MRSALRPLRTPSASSSTLQHLRRQFCRPRSSSELPLLAIVGTPNTGKSTLFNRLVEYAPRAMQSRALVSATAGTTRDRIDGVAEWEGVRFRVQDTGGIFELDHENSEPSVLERAVAAQVDVAVSDAAVVLFTVDSKAGVTAGDELIARELRRVRGRGGAAVLVGANKLDDWTRAYELAEFWSLGLGEPLGFSALHGAGTGELLNAVVETMRERGAVAAAAPPAEAAVAAADALADADALDADADADADAGALSVEDEHFGPLKVAVVGRPNVGKSSLLNAVLGEERVVVHEAAGTTRDSIATPLTWRGESLQLADTAGIRKRSAGGASREELDVMSVYKARETVRRAHVALLVFDAKEGMRRQDLAIADHVIEHHKSCVLVANKVDLLDAREREALDDHVREKLPMLRYAPIVHASATSGEGVDEAFDLALAAGKWRRERIPRIRLEELYQRATLLKPLPLVKNTGGKNRGALKIRSVAQSDTETPTFVFHLNRDAELHPSRMKWLENVIRQHYPFTATPLRLVLRGPKLREARFRKARKMGKVGKIVEARGQRSVK